MQLQDHFQDDDALELEKTFDKLTLENLENLNKL